MLELDNLFSEIVEDGRVAWIESDQDEERKKVLAAFEKASKEKF